MLLYISYCFKSLIFYVLYIPYLQVVARKSVQGEEEKKPILFFSRTMQGVCAVANITSLSILPLRDEFGIYFPADRVRLPSLPETLA